MQLRQYLPSAALAIAVPLVLLWRQLTPEGSSPVLVHLGQTEAPYAFAAAAEADAAVLAIPAPGYVVLRGDAARIRHVLGLTVAWHGRAGCGEGAP